MEVSLKEIWHILLLFTQDFPSLQDFRKYWIGSAQYLTDDYLRKKRATDGDTQHRAGVQQVSAWCSDSVQVLQTIQKPGLWSDYLLLARLSSSDTQLTIRANLQQMALYLWLSRHRCLMTWKRVGVSSLQKKMMPGTSSHRQWVFKTEDGCSSQTVLGSNTCSCSVYGILLRLHNFSELQSHHLSNGHDGHFLSLWQRLDGTVKWNCWAWRMERIMVHSLTPIFLIVFLSTVVFDQLIFFVISCLSTFLKKISLKTHFKKGWYHKTGNVHLRNSKGWFWETKRDSAPQKPVVALMTKPLFWLFPFPLSLSFLLPSWFLESLAKSLLQVLNFRQTQIKTICNILTNT